MEGVGGRWRVLRERPNSHRVVPAKRVESPMVVGEGGCGCSRWHLGAVGMIWGWDAQRDAAMQ